MQVFVLLVLTGVTLSSAAAEPLAPTSTIFNQRRVRTQDSRIQRALAAGAARSAAFRDVLSRVEARDVIVYIEVEPQLRGRLAGRMRWVASTKEARYVRVSINPELSSVHFIATLAHELQHVAEVGEAPSVINEPTLTAFYRGVGSERRVDSGAWDTEAAQATGDVVRKEVAASYGTGDQEPIVVGQANFGRQ